MVLKIEILDGAGKGISSRLTDQGELIVNKADYSSPYTADATVVNTGYNFIDLEGSSIEPKTGKFFVITEILISCDRNVGATSGALINVYEADSPTSITPTKEIVKDIEIVKNERIFMTQNMRVTSGKWVNIKTDDNNVRATIWGYYVDV